MSSSAKITPEIKTKFEDLKEETIKLFNTLCEPKGNAIFDKFRTDVKAIKIIESRKGGKMTRRKTRRRLK